MQPEPKLEALDDLIAQAEHYANFSMRNLGRLPPTLWLIGEDGPMMFVPESLGDEASKDDFATNARLMCIAHGATACVMSLEAWVKYAKPGEPLDTTEAPSEAFDRREVVVSWASRAAGRSKSSCPSSAAATEIFSVSATPTHRKWTL
jgi:hypothetical protein